MCMALLEDSELSALPAQEAVSSQEMHQVRLHLPLIFRDCDQPTTVGR